MQLVLLDVPAVIHVLSFLLRTLVFQEKKMLVAFLFEEKKIT